MAWPSNPKRPSIEEARQRLDKIINNLDGPYFDQKDRASPEERRKAISLAQQLEEVITGQRTWLDCEIET